MMIRPNPHAPHRISQKLTIIVAGSGLFIFAVTGFLGYCYNGQSTCPATIDLSHGLAELIDSTLLKPWPLFLWLCALVFILERSMLSSLKGVAPAVARIWRRWTYIVTAVSIVLVGVFEFYGKEIFKAIEDLLAIFGSHGLLFSLISSPWFYTLVNFGIILLLAGGAVRRWIRFSTEKRHVTVQATQGRQNIAASSNLPESLEMRELVIGDVLVRSTIVLILSFVIRFDTLSLIVPRPTPGMKVLPFSACSVAWPVRCSPQLSFLDLVIALLGLVGSVAFAAIVAQATTWGRSNGRNPADADPLSSTKMLLPSNEPGANEPAQPLTLAEIGNGVAAELLDILARPFTAIGPTEEGKRNPYDPLTVVRVIVWPLLIVSGIFGAATMARSTQHALHHTPWQAFPVPRLGRFPSDVSIFELSALLAGTVALVCIILAAGVISRKTEALARGLAFIRDNGFTTLVLFCVYALALWLVEVLLLQFVPLEPDGRPPLRLTAFGFGLFTVGSLFLLLWFAVSVVAGRLRKR